MRKPSALLPLWILLIGSTAAIGWLRPDAVLFAAWPHDPIPGFPSSVQGAAGVSSGESEEFVPGEIIIELAESVAEQARSRLDSSYRVKDARSGDVSLDALSRRFAVREMRAVLRAAHRYPDGGRNSPLAGLFLVRVGEDKDTLEALREYRSQQAIKSAQLNYIYTPDLVPNDPRYPQQYSHQLTSAAAGWDIETGDPSIVIAVIGLGTQLDHPDLAANIVPGYDFASNDPDPSPGPGEDHETQVSGSTAAVGDNGLGVAGICWSCKIMPLRVSYTTETVAAAIDFARVNGARVVNMSFGDYVLTEYGPDTIVETAVNAAFASGIVLVGTAGNDSIDTKRYPGAHDNVIGVAATTSTDQRAEFSNFGSWVDVAAPGAGILTTTIGGGYQSVNGTSFAAPYVAGLAGLILSKNPALSPATVKLMIEYSVDKIAADHFIGSGRVNVSNVLGLDGAPTLFAVIKSPENNDLIFGTNTVDIWGTALGEGYTLEYKPQAESSWTQFASGPQTINDALGTLDVTALPNGFYDFRLTSHLGGNQDVSQISLYRADGYQDGWPISTGAPIVASPSYADLDADGDPELLVGNNGGRVHVYRSVGAPLTGWPQSGIGPYVFSSPSVGDIDGDGDLEVVVGNYASSYVSAWHHTGAPVSGFPRHVNGAAGAHMRGAIPLVNLDADPALEMVVATTDGLVHVWNSNGSDLPGWPKNVDFNVQTTPAVGDIDGDGQMEIVIRQWKKIYAFEVNGTTVPGWPRTSDGGHASPVLGDIDGNGIVEIVDAEDFAVAAYDGGGNLKFRTPLPSGLNYSGLSLGDVNADGTLEIFVGADDGKVYGVTSQGAVMPGWPTLTGNDVNGTPIIADLDGDGAPEICIGSEDKKIYTWNPDGSPALQVYGVGWAIFGSAAAGDLDGDGDVELIAGDEDGLIHVLDLPALWNPQAAQWPQFQADARHTGHYRFEEAYGDSDGDGDLNVNDCAPLDPAVHHGAAELCNRIDDDCDATVDEGLDMDGDGVTSCAGDCDDGNAAVAPGRPELCDNLDNDCDSGVDGFPTFCGVGSCASTGTCTGGVNSCVPGDPSPEACDGLDNDCDGTPDDGFDVDQDGITSCAGDCDDGEATVAPGHPELCDNLDNDCNGVVDGFATSCGVGACESTGYCLAGVDSCVAPQPFPEVCDGLDNDCNGWIHASEMDSDLDGFRTCEGDCNDLQVAIYPGALEINDGMDNQCPGDAGSGLIDEILDDAGFPGLGSPTPLCWTAQDYATSYAVLRSGTPSFDQACETTTTAESCLSDDEVPAPDGAFYYLIRAAAPYGGSWGVDSSGEETIPACASESNCDDGVDNDGDGLVDCDDPDCGGCVPAVFTFQDTAADDVATMALWTFFYQLPSPAGNYILFEISGSSPYDGAWCAERADAYVAAYLEQSPMDGEFVSGSWNRWHRAEGGPWIGPVTDEFYNAYGMSCLAAALGVRSWCSEYGLGGRYLTVVPGSTAACEAYDGNSCGDGTWSLTIKVGPSRLSTCGF